MKLDLDYKKIWSEVVTASLIIIITAVAIFSFIVISKQNVDIYNPSSKVQVSQGSDKISEVLNLLQSKYMGELDVDSLIDGAIDGIFSQIDDPYTRYLSEDEYNDIVNSGSETYSGVGVHIAPNIKNKTVQIIGVMKNSPAAKAGIQAGDVIISVDGVESKYEEYSKVGASIRGEIGTTVVLKIKKNNTKEVTYEIQRENIIATNIESHSLSDSIGYIRIFEFTSSIYNEFKEAYDLYANDDKIHGLIIDLRNNSGGVVTQTLKIIDMFTDSGIMMKAVYADNTVKIYNASKGEYGKPLVILVNENSASASEIMTSSLKDLGKATIVGTTTFGKGIMQTILPLDNGGGVSITSAKYYTAAGKEIHEVGVEPDIVVDLPDDLKGSYTVSEEDDKQLKEGIKVIKNKLLNANKTN